MTRPLTERGYVKKRHVNLYPAQYDKLLDIAFTESKAQEQRVTISHLVRQAVDEWLRRRMTPKKGAQR